VNLERSKDMYRKLVVNGDGEVSREIGEELVYEGRYEGAAICRAGDNNPPVIDHVGGGAYL